MASGIECKQKTEPEYLKVESKTIDSRLQLAKEREKRETHYTRDVTVSLTAKYSHHERTGDFGNGAMSLVLSPKCGLPLFT